MFRYNFYLTTYFLPDFSDCQNSFQFLVKQPTDSNLQYAKQLHITFYVVLWLGNTLHVELLSGNALCFELLPSNIGTALESITFCLFIKSNKTD